MKTDYIRVRIEPELKRETEAVLAEVGLSMTDAVRLYCRRIVMDGGIPFDLRIPNAETIAAMQEDLSQAKRYDSVREMMEEILSEPDDED
jgi:DNA-damage-inducible protein J